MLFNCHTLPGPDGRPLRVLTPASPDAERFAEKQEGKRVEVRAVTAAARRSNAQNKTLWMWLGELAEQMGHSIDEMHRIVKLEQGVPILRRDDQAFVATYDRYLKGLDYKDKVEIIGIFEVTSRMNVKQMSELLESIWKKYTGEGLALTNPEDLASVRVK